MKRQTPCAKASSQLTHLENSLRQRCPINKGPSHRQLQVNNLQNLEGFGIVVYSKKEQNGQAATISLAVLEEINKI